FSEEFRKVNPKCELPALQIDGLTLTQSLPIIEYLEETRAQIGRPLLPKDPAKRAVVRKLSEIINSGIQPLQNLSVMRYLPPDDELAKVAGKFCLGDELSMADIFLVPQVVNAHRFHIDMSQYPLIERISSSLRELDEFRRTAPEVQPDAPQRGS
ncbi:putative maleylacetoacetate isomerase, partial [Opisthorchis viverrini]